MDKDSIKIKYIIGEYRDAPDFPTKEDFLYLMKNWWFHEGGQHFILTYRGIPDTGNVIFPDDKLKERLDGDDNLTKSLLNNLLSEGVIKVNKSTKFTVYYEII